MKKEKMKIMGYTFDVEHVPYEAVKSVKKTIKYFMLNNLGREWIWEAENEEEATKQYIYESSGCPSIEEYEKYCESNGNDSSIEWKECGKYGFKASEEVFTSSRGVRYHKFVFDNGDEP